MRQRDEPGELRLVCQGDVCPEAPALLARATAFGAPCAVENDDGPCGAQRYGQRGREKSAEDAATSRKDHERPRFAWMRSSINLRQRPGVWIVSWCGLAMGSRP